MAETAKILNPNKLYFYGFGGGVFFSRQLPSQSICGFKAAHPDHLVISYINCTAEIKAMSDTSAPVPTLSILCGRFRRSSDYFAPIRIWGDM